ncbi:MAG: hypothetical protein K8I60_12420 [Anaerolineae bacterium]|nr:hypothetical protein [Anaerolineae bacterium]
MTEYASVPAVNSRPSLIIRARRWALRVGFFTLVITTALCGFALANNHYNPLTFARIGTRFSEHDPHGTTGYDGQFVYFIARDGAQAVPLIDGPTLRYQRILYPVISRALSFGRADFVPWVLIAVNILAHSIGAALFTYLLVRIGATPLLGLLYTVWIGELLSVRLDLNEPLCFALSLAAVTAYLHQRHRWTVILLILAVLAKELALIFAAGLALHALSRRMRSWAALLVGAPLLTFLAWWGVMWLWFGTLPTRYPAAKLHLIPLWGMFTETSPVELIFLALWLGIPAVMLLGLAVYRFWRTREIPLGAALLLFGAAFVITMPDVSWQDPIAAYRVGMPLMITGMLFVAQCWPRRVSWLAALWGPALLVVLMAPTLWFGGA